MQPRMRILRNGKTIDLERSISNEIAQKAQRKRPISHPKENARKTTKKNKINDNRVILGRNQTTKVVVTFQQNVDSGSGEDLEDDQIDTELSSPEELEGGENKTLFDYVELEHRLSLEMGKIDREEEKPQNGVQQVETVTLNPPPSSPVVEDRPNVHDETMTPIYPEMRTFDVTASSTSSRVMSLRSTLVPRIDRIVNTIQLDQKIIEMLNLKVREFFYNSACKSNDCILQKCLINGDQLLEDVSSQNTLEELHFCENQLQNIVHDIEVRYGIEDGMWGIHRKDNLVLIPGSRFFSLQPSTLLSVKTTTPCSPAPVFSPVHSIPHVQPQGESDTNPSRVDLSKEIDTVTASEEPLNSLEKEKLMQGSKDTLRDVPPNTTEKVTKSSRRIPTTVFEEAEKEKQRIEKADRERERVEKSRERAEKKREKAEKTRKKEIFESYFEPEGILALTTIPQQDLRDISYRSVPIAKSNISNGNNVYLFNDVVYKGPYSRSDKLLRLAFRSAAFKMLSSRASIVQSFCSRFPHSESTYARFENASKMDMSNCKTFQDFDLSYDSHQLVNFAKIHSIGLEIGPEAMSESVFVKMLPTLLHAYILDINGITTKSILVSDGEPILVGYGKAGDRMYHCGLICNLFFTSTISPANTIMLKNSIRREKANLLRELDRLEEKSKEIVDLAKKYGQKEQVCDEEHLKKRLEKARKTISEFQ